MSKEAIKTISEHTKLFNIVQSTISQMINRKVKPLVYLAYELGATQKLVAQRMGVSEQAVSKNFPSKNEEAHVS